MAKLELELLKAQRLVLELQKAMLETAKEEAEEQPPSLDCRNPSGF